MCAGGGAASGGLAGPGGGGGQAIWTAAQHHIADRGVGMVLWIKLMKNLVSSNEHSILMLNSVRNQVTCCDVKYSTINVFLIS